MDIMNKTIIYYSGNTEESGFEANIIADLKQKAGDIPIVSVTQIPLDLGTNICIGRRPFSYTTEWKQVLIALKASKTKFCIAAESDCIYPPEYFAFTPPEEKMMYNYDNIYLVWKFKNNYWRKTGSCEGAQICDREYWIKQLEPLLPEKWEPYTRKEETALVRKMFPERKKFTGNPMVTFKTRDGVSYRSTFISESKTKNIPYWGDIHKLKERFL